MTRRSVLLTLTAAFGVVLLAVCGGVFWMVRSSGAQEGDCAARIAAEEAEIHTDRRWDAQDVPGIGAYPEIHWQVDHPSFACSRAPGPTDRRYQAVVRLADADARALSAAWAWTPVAGTAPEVWPGLTAYVPDGVRWHRSVDRDAAGGPELRFDPQRSLVLFTVAQS
ncbi:hypothetical protein [Micromonospora sp. DT31]|uniref:hypothetical protein n=1 Tax=Micromonospora sp. DT31 TaxID=3393434 RepID=UPI003CEE5FDA